MAIQAPCSGCGKTVKAGDEWAGRKAKCPQCGGAILFAAAAALPLPPPPPPPAPPVDDGFDDAVAEASSVSKIIGAIGERFEQATTFRAPPADRPAKAAPQKVIVTRVKLSIGNMVELVLGFWIASFFAGILLAIVFGLLFAALGISVAGLAG